MILPLPLISTVALTDHRSILKFQENAFAVGFCSMLGIHEKSSSVGGMFHDFRPGPWATGRIPPFHQRHDFGGCHACFDLPVEETVGGETLLIKLGIDQHPKTGHGKKQYQSKPKQKSVAKRVSTTDGTDY